MASLFAAAALYACWVWYWVSGIETYPLPAYARRVEHQKANLHRGRAARLNRMARRQAQLDGLGDDQTRQPHS